MIEYYLGMFKIYNRRHFLDVFNEQLACSLLGEEERGIQVQMEVERIANGAGFRRGG